MTSAHAVDVRRVAGWLPEQDGLEAWLEGHRERVSQKGEPGELHPVIAEFQELIDSDPVVRMYAHQMIEQVPRAKPYSQRHLESVEEMLRLINELMTMAPEFGENMVATPLAAILDWTMGTPAGFAAYRDRRINAMLKKILNAWCEFLSSGDSLYVLNDSATGWKSSAAQRAVGMLEVSSCVINPTIEPGYHVAKGEELGHFQYGGSTYCLVFRPGVISDFALAAIPQPHDPQPPLVNVCSQLATAR